MEAFLQEPPVLGDAWASDPLLREVTHFHLGDELTGPADHVLAPVGAAMTSREVLELGRRAESEPAHLISYGPWGDRRDEIVVSQAYERLGALGVEAGVTALPYEDEPFGDRARIVWAAVLSLWGPSSALYSCPVAMTDAAARTLLRYGGADDLEVVQRLISRSPQQAWTSGQWMTETTGGSDVSGTETRAVHGPDGLWRLHGMKWFTSATTSQVALTLARPEGAPQGSRGLSLFRVLRTLPDGSRNAIIVRRLKDKLGTRAMPTAELELRGAVATPVGDPADGGGLRRIATMLNVTRLHNALGATGSMGRGLGWAHAYASVRTVFGKPLEQMPLHRATLADLEVTYAAGLALAFRCAELLGRAERGSATREEQAVLRGLTPIAKLATGRWAVDVVAECMEAVGGVGYCEDSTIPALVRNTHVLPIWEGTTNVLSLDLLRAAQRDDAATALLDEVEASLSTVAEEIPRLLRDEIAGAVTELRARFAALGEREAAEAAARSLALGLALTYACARLALQGAWAAERGDGRTLWLAQRLAERGLVPPMPPAIRDRDDSVGTPPVWGV